MQYCRDYTIQDPEVADQVFKERLMARVKGGEGMVRRVNGRLMDG